MAKKSVIIFLISLYYYGIQFNSLNISTNVLQIKSRNNSARPSSSAQSDEVARQIKNC